MERAEYLYLMVKIKKARDIEQWLNNENGVLTFLLISHIKQYYEEFVGVKIELR